MLLLQAGAQLSAAATRKHSLVGPALTFISSLALPKSVISLFGEEENPPASFSARGDEGGALPFLL